MPTSTGPVVPVSDVPGTDPEIPGISLATYTFNSNIEAIYKKFNDFIVETLHCNSANIAAIMPADLARSTARIDSIRKYINNYAVVEPLLDMVKTGQKAKLLEPGPNVIECQNKTLDELAKFIRDSRDEIANSQSSRLPNNLIKFDTVRILANLDKMDKLLAYDAASEPLDSPESTPDVLMTGEGNVGV